MLSTSIIQISRWKTTCFCLCLLMWAPYVPNITRALYCHQSLLLSPLRFICMLISESRAFLFNLRQYCTVCTALHCTARCLPLPPHSQSTRGPHLWQVLSMLINSIYLFISLSLALPVYPFSSLLLHIFLSISPYHSISPTLYTSPLNPLSKSLSRYSFISIYLFLFRSIRTNWYTFLFLHQSHHLNLKICPSSLLPALSVHLTLFVYFSAFAIHFLSYSVPPSYSFSLSNCVYPSDSDFVSHSDSLYLTVSVSVSLSFSNCLSATFC